LGKTDSITSKKNSAYRMKTVAIAVIIIAVALSLLILKPAAPREITLLTGPVGSNDYELGVNLAKNLEDEGLHVKVSPSSGSIDNLLLLTSGAEDTVAFSPSSLETVLDESVDTSRLVSLGSVTYQPLWLFYRKGLQIQRVPDLAGSRVALGPETTVAGYISRLLLDANGVSNQIESVLVSNEDPDVLAGALKQGGIDAAFAMGNLSSAYISALLSDENIAFLSFERADAYGILSKAISKHRIPEGVLDLARNIPSSDTVLLAITTNLITLDSFHSATIPVLLQAVSNADRQNDILNIGKRFPNADNTTLPLARAAKRYYSQGQKGLSKVLPYKVTRWLNHLGFVVLPLLTVLVVLLKVVVVLIKLRASVRFNGFYRKLETIERASASGANPQLVHQDLDLLDDDCVDFSVPRSMREQYLNLRQLIHDLRERLPETAEK
jgi:TRAP-type uncharacterized transport system substrate-binding protein